MWPPAGREIFGGFPPPQKIEQGNPDVRRALDELLAHFLVEQHAAKIRFLG